jgi:hypothetical protein
MGATIFSKKWENRGLCLAKSLIWLFSNCDEIIVYRIMVSSDPLSPRIFYDLTESCSSPTGAIAFFGPFFLTIIFVWLIAPIKLVLYQILNLLAVTFTTMSIGGSLTDDWTAGTKAVTILGIFLSEGYFRSSEAKTEQMAV